MPVLLKKMIVLAAGLMIIQSSLHAAITLTDKNGQGFSLQQPARRIISLSPHITELLFAVGAGQWVAGTVEHSDFPKRAQSVARVGNHQALDLEAILALKPDLVLAWSSGNPARVIEKIRAMGIPVYETGAVGLNDIASQLRSFSRLAGVAGRGDEVASHFERLLDELRQQYAHRPVVNVFFQIWDRPLMSINGRHYINDVIELCGGRNIFADLDMLAPTIGREAVISRDPEVIFVNGKGELYQQWLADWKQWSHLKAVRQGSLYEIESHTIAQPTPRILMGIKKVCRALDVVRQAREKHPSR